MTSFALRTVRSIRGGLCRHATAAADLLWPPFCPRCRARAARASDQFCESCWASLRPLRGGEDAWLLPPEVDTPALPACAAFAVDSLFLEMLASSKYRLFRGVGHRLSAESARRLAGRFPGTTLVPVPLRPDRRRARGFNQTEDFAAALAAGSGARVVTDRLVRRKGGPALAGLERAARAEVVRAAFAARAWDEAGAESPMWLVDDVITTGSTARSCAAAVKRAGGTLVGVVAMGRAFGPRTDPAVPDLDMLARL